MAAQSLTPETFLAVTEMIAGHLRMKEGDRWTPHVCRLKFHSFQSQFPEVNEAQLMWAAEMWIQSLNPAAFARFPTWRELMAPLYRTEGGLANRSWGFREDLPPFARPSAAQLAQLPPKRSMLPPPDTGNPEAYVPFEVDRRELPLLPMAEAGLTPRRWKQHLAEVMEDSE